MSENNSFLRTVSNLNIRTKLIIAVVSIVFILSLAMGTYLYTVQINELTQQLQEKGMTISNTLVENSVNPILHDDIIKLQNLVEITKKTESDVSYAFILDSNGNVIVHTFKDGFPIAMKNVNPANGEQKIKLLDIGGEYISDIANPVLDGKLGEVHVGISQTGIRDTIQRSTLVFTIFTAISLIIGAFIAFTAGNIITKPIVLLEDGAKEFGKGNFDHKIVVKNEDEIGNLAHTFNDMATEIQTLMYKHEQAAANVMDTKNYLDAIIEGSHDVIFVVDVEGRFEFVNDAFLTLSGYDKNEIIGQKFMILVPDDYRDFILQRWEEVQNGMGEPYETKAITKHGLIKDIMVSHTDVEFSDGTKYVISAKDITEIKKIEEMKNNIISNISHELRTPITIMRGFIEVAMNENDLDKRNEYLSRAINAIDRQNRMVQDLIETAMGEIKSIKLVFENVDFKDVLDTSLKDVEPKANLSNIDIKTELEKDLYLYADPQQMTYVFTKLMDNAIKFTKNGGRIEISAKYTNDGFVEVCVKDTGIGISKENVSKIFDKFFQVDATTTRKYSGSGVGLTISKNIIEKHGGQIWVESDPGKGTSFFFTIPKASGKQMSINEYN
ncbi:MAG: cell wall metabolism sensor histidine kinase WalK [Methanosarcinaceae archaeon]|nr:cell wall metabolism sensor histidine kinase WalK [Methanosarcinaceae archaeon]